MPVEKASTAKKARAKTVHAKAAARHAPMVMLDANAKAIALRVKAKDNAATMQAQDNVTVVAKAARKDKAIKVPAAIARLVRSMHRARTTKTMISNPVPTRTWAHKVASTHSVTSRKAVTAPVNLTLPAPAST